VNPLPPGTVIPGVRRTRPAVQTVCAAVHTEHLAGIHYTYHCVRTEPGHRWHADSSGVCW
jgi:hypothetical protein